jgi:hypothetical protein
MTPFIVLIRRKRFEAFFVARGSSGGAVLAKRRTFR